MSPGFHYGYFDFSIIKEKCDQSEYIEKDIMESIFYLFILRTILELQLAMGKLYLE